MQVSSTRETEIRLTLEVAMELVNGLDSPDLDIRTLLADTGFSRAAGAPRAAIDRLGDRMVTLAPLLSSLPDADADHAIRRVNEELTELPISPSVVEHDGAGPHIHWTPSTARFDDQVVADILMALAQELCDDGTSRFGRCHADDCDHVFYDATRNRSRRFCDTTCAGRTHTARHRARNRR